MRITKTQLQSVIKNLLKEQVQDAPYYGHTREAPNETKYFGTILRKFNVPEGMLNDFFKVWDEWEVRSPTSLQRAIEKDLGWDPMPPEFYVEMIPALRRYKTAYDKYLNSSYTPGWRD